MSSVPSPNWPWPATWAPQWLNQPINPGWSLVQVNYANSRAPDVEREVVSKHSYGRQIGRLMDAVVALAELVPDAQKHSDVKPLLELAREVEQIKDKAKERRSGDLLDELKALKKGDPKAWAELVKSVNG